MKQISKKILLSRNVFRPTATSDLLYHSVLKYIKKPSKILDLGCGSGYVGVSIAKNTNYKNHYYFSDISNHAVKLTKKNAKRNNINFIIKKSNIFSSWKNEKFDIIVNDVSGISNQISKISPWYKNVSNNSGPDGTKLTIKFINEASKYLNKKGFIFFPIISLSDTKKVLVKAKKKFRFVKKINTKEWPMPPSMYRYRKKIINLKKKGFISFKEKFGLMVFQTDIYIAK